ncbi:hypothetical protein LEP1GSC202_0787 [Leptospira yanagawae serovar Saopaulo str. Sao Paulo = ATCC 700523]|uniref:Uncharacterized protein n=2 Tax=Leptospira yanagawae TaxID=293069 RepID=A0A5E8HF28_9LEPT|nr:hypothetical protein LEP1GSC202_0787 [Leptospira yanagawae serovar Saopaulo str. Sao Paulo = ATCC 700523]
MNIGKKISREDFMEFFRNIDELNQLTPDDRIEIFKSILLGSSDITKELLDDLLINYSVDNLGVIEFYNDEKQ